LKQAAGNHPGYNRFIDRGIKAKIPPAITLALICGNVTVDCEASALMFAMPNLPGDVAQLFRAALRRGNSAGDAAPH
jgi:hypothetical protein